MSAARELAASEDFGAYPVGTSFTTGKTLGAAGSGWAYGWRTSGSFASPKGTVAIAGKVDDAAYLACTFSIHPGKSAASGSIARAYDAASFNRPFEVSFALRPDGPADRFQYSISDNRTLTPFGPDASSSWQIASINGTWQACDGSADGSSGAMVDTKVAVVPGTTYTFSVAVDPVDHSWSLTIFDGISTVAKTGLTTRAGALETDAELALGGRWITFNAREIVAPGSATSAGTVGFSIDSVLLERHATVASPAK